MAKHCIGCKREVSQGITHCPFCGAEQSFFQYYLKSIVVITLILMSGLVAGYYLVNQSVAQAKVEIEQSSNTALMKAEENIQQLKSQLSETQNRLTAAQEEIRKSVESQSATADQAGALEAELNKKLKTAQADAKRQQDRAGWLSRENARLKTEIEGLKQQVADLQASQSPVQPEPVPAIEQTSQISDNNDSN